VAAKGATGDMYEQLIAISEMSFAGGHHEAAYHALMAALYGVEPRYESFSAINDLVSSLGDTVRFIG
jgi:hypothetical protein